MESFGLEKASLAEAIIFFVLAGATIAGAICTITRRNPVAAVMSLVGTFFALAGIYATLSAHFIAVIQISVYAGAIMVLFIFVVMILNRDEIEPVSFRGIITRAVGVVAAGFGVYLAVQLVYLGKNVPVLRGPAGPLAEDFGTVAAAGNSLFRDFVFPFEAISLLLLVAIVGGIILSRSQRQEDDSLAVAEHHRAMRLTARTEERVGAVPGDDAHGHGSSHGSGASHH